MTRLVSNSSWKRRIIAGTIACTTFTAAVAVATRASTAAAAPASFDGETLVRGIFFSEGPAASLLPATRYTRSQKTVAAPDELAQLRSRITSRLHSDDPSLLERFTDDLYSGDVVRVDRALEAMAHRIDVLSNDEGYHPGKVASGSEFIWLGIGYWIAYNPKDPDLTTNLHRNMVAEVIVQSLTPSTI